jgi:oligopeptide/dipeptide ABC transporter ATP-binding protein
VINLPDEVIRLENVTKDFIIRTGLFSKGKKNRAIDKVNLTVLKGEILGVVGESGSGKTTLGMVLLGMTSIDSGKIYFEGKEISTLDRHIIREFRLRSQMIFQDPFESLNPMLTVSEAVNTPLIIEKGEFDRRERHEKIVEALGNAGLQPADEFLMKIPSELSGGQRQRVGIARALINNPSFIVADEPVSMLDVSIRADILNLLKDQTKSRSMSMIFISHDIAITRYIADRIVVMHLGQIVEQGSSIDIVENPKHPYTVLLLKSMPELSDRDLVPVDEQIDYNVDTLNTGKDECSFVSKCPFAMEECSKRRPEMKEIDPGHFVACYLF